ncbi:ATP-binding protein [Bradyrhizobium sp. SZCCHNRI1009]|uniref:ATP-binding protein n=1 Tax=Bradyrhizobium sp. SZCCHNRI1009 TaxID=3057277 RepID=UPI002916FDD3|nr:ATP-binding protein [Bradyrhizobium sp. SZCCHNRI1009]
MIGSLRGRLFAGLTAVIVVAGAVGGAFAYVWAYDEAIEMQDSVLNQIGVFALSSPIRQSQPLNGVDAESEIAVVELGELPHGPADNRRFWGLRDGLHNDTYQGQPVRALLRTRPDGTRLAITQRTEIRTELASDMALRTLLPILALIPCLMLVIAIVIARSLRPMVVLAGELDARKPDDIEQLKAATAPSELQPFLDSINGLLRRMRAMMEQQRRFIDDAAHELRTPITALSLQAENLDLMEMPAASRERLAALKSGMRRTKHLLEQLLALARHDAETPATNEPVQLDRITKGVVADLLPEAATRDIDVGFTMAETVVVEGTPFFVISAVRNLIENAIKFTPDGGSVDIGIYREGEAAIVQIEDTGPGIPPSDLDRIFEPFFRSRQAGGEGSGLGLSIVKRIVERYRGSIYVENIVEADRSGLRVILRLPASDKVPA